QASLKQAQIDIQSNQANLDNLLSPQATAVQAQQLKLDSSRLTLQQRQKDTAGLTVAAPASGVIASVKVVEGSDIANNALLFTIYDESTPALTVSVPQAAAAAIKPGQKVSVELPGFGTVVGVIEARASAASPAGGNRDASVPVGIALPALPGVRAGMVGQTSIEATGLTYRIEASGTIDDDAVEVRAPIAATAGKVTVQEGDHVRAGDTLLRMAADSLGVQVQQAENDVKTQQQSLDTLLNPASDPSGQLRTLTTKLDQSKVTLASRQQDVADLEVKAPVDGVISSLTPRVGDRIDAKGQLFRVADYNAMQITIVVDELDIAKAKVGQTASITLDALPGKNYKGTVVKINPEGIYKNDIATFEVTVQVGSANGLLAGMNSTVNMVVAEASGLYLPAQVVRVQQGKAMVQVLEGTQVVSKEVQVGLRTQQQVEVLGGLKEGDKVIQTIIRPQSASGGFGLFGGGGNRNQQQGQTGAPAGGAGNAGAGAAGGANRQRSGTTNGNANGR
ncbi:MAG: rane-fusion protein, partial [Firmicutes bacterium]|nr:rane-fusion protein [Bacillota bacterium]